jgi:3-oxoacyl-[acyl-carrier-protein] synthase-1
MEKRIAVNTLSWLLGAGNEVCICGIGARTPLGFDVMASAAAVRGAISAVGDHPFLIDKVGDPISLACDPGLNSHTDISNRLEQMLRSALNEAVNDLSQLWDGGQIECWIGLPEPRPGLPPEIGKNISAVLSSSFDFAPLAINVLQRGHASGLMAIQAVAQKISAGEVDVCLVSCVDSYYDPDTFKWLDNNRVLMSPTNRNGFPPSEAAAACLLASRSAANLYGLEVLATVTAASTAIEPYPIRSQEVCVGEGLTAVLRGVSSRLSLPKEAISATYCDLNGERYRNEEFVYALLRMQDAFIDAHDYLCPSDCWGDVGAASGPLFVSLAIAACQRGYSKGPYPVLWAGAESGYRSAVLLNLDNSPYR